MVPGDTHTWPVVENLACFRESGDMTELEFEEDYYGILGVDDEAAPEDVRKAYLKLAKKLHPDRFPNDEQGKQAAQIEFRRVTQAHYVLGEPDRRAEYD